MMQTCTNQPAYHPESYWSRRFARRLGLSTVGYRSLGWSYNCWLYAARKAALLRTIRALDLDVAGAAVLEVGVGSGFYVPIWKRLGARRVVGVDITQASVDRMTQLHPDGRFVRLDVREPFDLKEYFDIVTGFDALFHIVDDAGFDSAVRNMSAHLAPRGRLLVTDCLVTEGERGADHVRYRTREEWQRAFAGHGMAITQVLPQLSLMHPGNHLPGLGGAVAARVLTAVVRMARLPNRVSREAVGAAAGSFLYPWELLATRGGRSAEGTIFLIIAEPCRDDHVPAGNESRQ